MESGTILVNEGERWSQNKITDKDLRAVLYFRSEKRKHQKLTSWSQLDFIIILFNAFLALTIFLAVYVDFLYMIMFGWGLYVVPISISLLCPKLKHENLDYYLGHLNDADNFELLFVHEGDDGVEDREKVPGLHFVDKTKPFDLEEPKQRIREIEIFHDCKLQIKEKEVA